MKKYFLLFSTSLFLNHSFCQQAIDVTEQTLKIGAMKTEELLFGFTEGDQIVFNFSEADKKELKEVEIIEYPSNSKFSDYKTSKIENKVLNVSTTGIYKFRFYNSAIAARVCKIKIQRIPGSEATKNYNTSVRWISKQDTAWNSYTKDVIVGYDTAYEQKTTKELTKTELREEVIFDKQQRVHSETNANGNKTSVFFTLPKNEYAHNKTSTVVSWAYWVGVNDEANVAWRQNVQGISKLVNDVAKVYSSPLGALAVGAVTELAVPKVGEDVYYAITNPTDRTLFHVGQSFRFFDNGKGVAGYRKFTDKALCQGSFFVCLSNDNMIQGIDATVKVIAIIETKYFEDKAFTEEIIKPRYEKKIFKDPVISNARVPVAG